ncbi:2-amino-4-hydroxy-6-hydroxymethyldihydropteridine diphosphokinase [Pseudooceanicola sp. LIPI14-2-Ac024]|uniref:2-amino-4-hydroxy-6- hydroxymethyldihydropteridine diphosphokinase n=1 Tax=Pseudooceanicola sp. LIPI14-2-Ac024 TaxID=3344875 RepID=UPI0035CF9B39
MRENGPRRYLAAIGGNQPNGPLSPVENVLSGLAALGPAGLHLTACSALYRTPAFPSGSGPDFVNAAMAFTSAMAPDEVMEKMHLIEAAHNRERRERWAGRTLDLDLLDCDGIVQPDGETWRHWHDLAPERQRETAPGQLILPHPRLHERAFVLVPLRDVAPAWRHPILARTVAEMCADLPAREVDSVVRVADPPCVSTSESI